MPGDNRTRRKVDPEAALRSYFEQELGLAEAKLPSLPPLPGIPANPGEPYQSRLSKQVERPGYGIRSNLASLLLAACVLSIAALALSCAPRAALARSIDQVVESQGLEKLKQETITAVGLVWQQGQEHFRQKHFGIITTTGTPAVEKENL